MLLKEAKKVLEAEGIIFNETETMKGSCIVPGLSIGEGIVRPTIYEKSIEDMDQKEFMAFVAEVMSKTPEIDISITKDRDAILRNSISCIRHQTDDVRAVKFPVFGDLEEYVRINIGDDINGNNMSFIANHELIKNLDISPEELRFHARSNLRGVARIQGMSEILGNMMGDAVPVPDVEEFMYVASTVSKCNGAAVMLLQDLLQEFCNKHGLDAVTIIPSSIHEVILVPAGIPIEEINLMINEVNGSQVDPWEQLSDHVYTFVA